MRHSHTRTMPGRTLSSGNKYTKSDARSQDMWHEKTVIPWRGGVADRRDALFAIRYCGLFSVSVSVYIAFASFCLDMFCVCLSLLRVCLALFLVCFRLLSICLGLLAMRRNGQCRHVETRLIASLHPAARPTAYHPATPAHRPARHGTARCGARHLMPLR